MVVYQKTCVRRRSPEENVRTYSGSGEGTLFFPRAFKLTLMPPLVTLHYPLVPQRQWQLLWETGDNAFDTELDGADISLDLNLFYFHRGGGKPGHGLKLFFVFRKRGQIFFVLFFVRVLEIFVDQSFGPVFFRLLFQRPFGIFHFTFTARAQQENEDNRQEY